MALLRLVHLLGFTAWLGSGLALMVMSIVARSEPASSTASLARVQWAVTRLLLLPGALLTVFSGLMLTFRLMHGSTMGNPWMVTMQGAGLVGGFIALFVVVPASARLAKLDPGGPHAAHVARTRGTLRIASSLSGALGLLALLAAALYRSGA